MSEFTYTSPLAGVIKPGVYGASKTAPGVAILETWRSLYSIMPRNGQQSVVSGVTRERYGLPLPDIGRVTSNAEHSMIWSGLNQWMLAGALNETDINFPELADALKDMAALVDHSHARSIIRLSGSQARHTLAKLCALDTHPRSFSSNYSAATRMAHISTLIHQIDAAPLYEIYVPRAFARSFFSELCEAAAEYGYIAEPLRRDP
ncbi:MAG: sarcosine oxidase subunit gamma [marine bacterium B5-7]|nr:MAG: sarcosine oxidase subunit gamma [marine bacterium B5-7]